MRTLLSVDIGGTKISAALIEQQKIMCRQQISTPSSQSAELMTQALTTLLTPLSKEADAVTVASTGIIDKGVLTALNAKNLGGLNHYPIKQIISEITQLNTFVINDAQAAAWAEYKALTSPVSNMAFITVSTGVGAGIIIDNKLQIGSKGIAGHAGHTLADPLGPICGCGRTGCVESIASGSAIGLAGKAFFGETCTGEQVFQHYQQGNLDAANIINQSAKAIANLIADLTISLDLELVTLGGSVGLAKGYIDLVNQYLLALPSSYHTPITQAITGADAGLVGAADWFNRHHIEAMPV